MESSPTTDPRYAAPLAEPPAAPDDPKAKATRSANRSLALLAAGVGTIVLGGLLAAATDSRTVLFLSASAGTLLGGSGLVLAGASMIRSFSAVALVSAVFNLGMTLFGALMALMATVSFSRGRQIRSLGKAVLPPVAEGEDWARARLKAPLDVAALAPDVRSGLAAQWRENGKTEHASVAAFARLTLDLMALGAPPSLVASSNHDALDEIRHAELCFALARKVDGRVESPAAFPEAVAARGGLASRASHRSLALVDLAVSSLIDGALNEGVSARIVARLAKTCEEPAIKAVLKEIAADEGRHAAHGWDVVEWCLAEGGEPVLAALEGAARAFPERLASNFGEDARRGAWQRFGIPGEALEAEEFAKTRADVVRRVQRFRTLAAA